MFCSTDPILIEIVQSKWEIIINYLPLTIALLAVCVSLYSNHIQRNHNKKSVKPLIKINRKDIPNEISITLMNCGLGPLLIKSFDISINNLVIFDNFNSLLRSSSVLMAARAEHAEEASYIISDTKPAGKWLASKDEMELLMYRSDSTDPVQKSLHDKILKTISGHEMIITYSDIYNMKPLEYKELI